MPFRRLVLAAALFTAAAAVAVAQKPADDPLSADERAALQKKLGELAGLDEKAKQLIDQLRDNPALLDQLMKNGMPGGPKGLGQNPFNHARPFPPPVPQPRPPVIGGDGPRPDRPAPKFDGPKLDIQKMPLPNWEEMMRRRQQPDADLDPRLANNPGLQHMLRAWEKNVGPLDDTPELKKALVDFFDSQGPDGLGGLNGAGNDFLSKLDLGADGKLELDDWLKGVEGRDWNPPDLGMKDWFAPKNPNAGGWGDNWGGGFKLPTVNGPGAPSTGGGGFGGLPGIDSPWLPLLLIVLAVAGYFGWKYFPKRDATPTAAEALASGTDAWPVDPRAINSREQLVVAFEFLSLLLCGDKARVWNHHTIAAALRAQVPGSDPIADELARLYEIARYSPPNDPLTDADLAAARRGLCALAGVPAA